MATINPSAAFVRRLIPTFIVEAVLLAACVFAWVMTENDAFLYALSFVVVGCFAWILYMLWRNPTEWRWWNGTPGARS